MAWWDNLTGGNRSNYYVNTGRGLAASSINDSNAGGIGNYGYVKGNDGNYTGVSEDAYNAMQQNGTSDLYTGNQMKDIASANGISDGGWFGKGGIVQNGASAMQALGGLASAYTGYQNYKLAKDQFDYEKALSNTNLANQGKLINNQIMNSAEVGNALAGSTLTDAQKQAGLAAAQSKYVRTSI